MRNKKVAMNERRANRLNWRMEQGKLYAETYVEKKLLDTFKVKFELVPTSGETAVLIENLWDKKLSMNKTQCKDFETAVNEVNAFFNRMDELIDKMPLEACSRAYNAYRKEIARAIESI